MVIEYYSNLLAPLKCIVRCFFLSRFARRFITFFVVPWTMQQMVLYAKRQQVLEEAREADEALRIDLECEEGQYNTCLTRSRTSGNLFACSLAASMQMRRRKVRAEVERERMRYPPLERLCSEREVEKDRLFNLKCEVEDEVGRLEAEILLQEKFPTLLRTDPTDPKAAVEEAEENLAISIAELERDLHNRAQDLRNRIYGASWKHREPREDDVEDCSIGETVTQLMHSLEYQAKRTFVKTRNKLRREQDAKLDEEDREKQARETPVRELSVLEMSFEEELAFEEAAEKRRAEQSRNDSVTKPEVNHPFDGGYHSGNDGKHMYMEDEPEVC